MKAPASGADAMPAFMNAIGVTRAMHFIAPAVASRTGYQRQLAPELLNTFRLTGGVVAAERLAVMMGQRWDQPISVLARWIVQRRIVHFTLEAQLMVPLFQFDLKNLAVLPEVGLLTDILRDSHDDWALAMWFASPNRKLDGVAPAEAISSDFDAVLAAARADSPVVVS